MRDQTAAQTARILIPHNAIKARCKYLNPDLAIRADAPKLGLFADIFGNHLTGIFARKLRLELRAGDRAIPGEKKQNPQHITLTYWFCG